MIIVPTEKRFDWKHAPLVLISIVALNILVFFLYQSGDDKKYTEVFTRYYSSESFELEWPEFKRYLESINKTEVLAEYEELYRQENHETLSYYMLENRGFNRYLEDNANRIVGRNSAGLWWLERDEMHRQVRSISILSQGLDANDISFWNLISHQFLHGDLMHLVGNLVFLVLCGFAVEAAIGHWRFLVFYLVSGISGGLLYAVLNKDSSASLVGASGAISGVMAMYLGVFRLKRIEFFYWILVFVGYIRLPALLVLPFYIGKEFYSLYNDEGSNVAFMAHVGGFVAGGALMGLSFLISPKALDKKYVEEDQTLPPLQKDLAVVYQLIERLQFERAGIALNDVMDKHGSTFELALLRYKMLQVNKGKTYKQSIVDLIGIQPLSEAESRELAAIWKDNKALQEALPDEVVLQLAMKLSPFLELGVAEDVLKRLTDKNHNPQSLGILARKISMAYQRANNRKKQQQYEQLAEQMLMGSAQ